MATLNINAFSCLDSAVVELAPITVLIGPQGSGKSVTTKLSFFFHDILSTYLNSAERGESLAAFKKALERLFVVWFPPAAWGGSRFNITFTAGAFTARALRRVVGRKLTDEVTFSFCDWFSEHYKKAEQVLASVNDDQAEVTLNNDVNRAFDRAWRLKSVLSKELADQLGEKSYGQQMFIPAGRAFFTSIGRLVAAFEHAGSLDPLTIRFARLFATLKERASSRHVYRLLATNSEFENRRDEFMYSFFGGTLEYRNDAEYVASADGRNIPFTYLSSGQQELLPMWFLVDYLNQTDLRRDGRSSMQNSDLIYIEEPEAHLFPSAQSLLIQFLISSVASSRGARSLVLTTHSPYIMSKLSLFLKAGQLARKKKKSSEISEVVPRDCWLTPDRFAAYAIKDRTVHSIVDDEGLIDGRYLDQISEDLSQDFSALLDIETSS